MVGRFARLNGLRRVVGSRVKVVTKTGWTVSLGHSTPVWGQSDRELSQTTAVAGAGLNVKGSQSRSLMCLFGGKRDHPLFDAVWLPLYNYMHLFWRKPVTIGDLVNAVEVLLAKLGRGHWSGDRCPPR